MIKGSAELLHQGFHVGTSGTVNWAVHTQHLILHFNPLCHNEIDLIENW